MRYEEITLVSPSTTPDNQPELVVTKALMLVPGVAVFWGNGQAVIDVVQPCEWFNGVFYEVAPGYEYSLAEFHYDVESEILPQAEAIIQRVYGQVTAL